LSRDGGDGGEKSSVVQNEELLLDPMHLGGKRGRPVVEPVQTSEVSWGASDSSRGNGHCAPGRTKETRREAATAVLKAGVTGQAELRAEECCIAKERVVEAEGEVDDERRASWRTRADRGAEYI
jgi:hypothetical protein